MANAALVPLIHPFLEQVVPFFVVAGVAGLFLGGLWRWLELGAPRATLSLHTSRPRPAANVSAINRDWESIPDCPMCNVPMVKRVARHGPRAGTQFWGCSNFPMCRCTRERK